MLHVGMTPQLRRSNVILPKDTARKTSYQKWSATVSALIALMEMRFSCLQILESVL